MKGSGRPELAGYSDAELADLVRSGDSDAFAELTARYLDVVRARVAPFRSGSMDADDLCQEGLLGLLSAARTYSASGGASFRTYAGVCISNRIVGAYRVAAGHKNDPLRDFVSLSREEDPDSVLPPDPGTDPEALFADRDSYEAISRNIEKELTALEMRVLRLYVSGRSYREIARLLSIRPKAVDNALQRVRFKLKHGVCGQQKSE